MPLAEALCLAFGKGQHKSLPRANFVQHKAQSQEQDRLVGRAILLQHKQESDSMVSASAAFVPHKG